MSLKSTSAGAKLRKALKNQQHSPLAQQIEEFGAPKQRHAPRVKSNKHVSQEQDFVDEKSSKKILDLAKKQLAEAEEEEEDEEAEGDSADDDKRRDRDLLKSKARKSTGKNNILQAAASAQKQKRSIASTKNVDSDSDEDVASDDENEESYGDGYFEIDEEDEKAMQAFMPTEAPARRTLGDILREKIKEKETEIQSQMSDVSQRHVESNINPKVVQVYTSVGQLLSKYRSGKLPKAFKIIPTLTNWEEILFLTNPEGWSAAAMYMATKIFSSNLNAKMAQRFFNLILLPRIRDDIAEFKRLNYHLYMALKKSLFKPEAFFKGILLPLCQAGNCTLREAVIVSSVISKVSVPHLHSAAAMIRIAEMPYSGACSIFLRMLFDKKYALPYQVIDACVLHFLHFQSEKRALPVLWHQCLLTFVQRYKADIATEQKEALLDLLRAQSHPLITPEIRREIVQSKSRDVEMIFGDASTSESLALAHRNGISSSMI